MDGNSAIFNTTVWEVPSDMLTFAQDLNEVMEQDLQLFWERAFQAERKAGAKDLGQEENS